MNDRTKVTAYNAELDATVTLRRGALPFFGGFVEVTGDEVPTTDPHDHEVEETADSPESPEEAPQRATTKKES